ncbi:hypothetical protein B0H14DRAFT_2564635 [Mycena olivaceomarginata]|nr:hypothetical protein B0H14DRAFT_2564635 [Mycena olivaceomarginata]
MTSNCRCDCAETSRAREQGERRKRYGDRAVDCAADERSGAALELLNFFFLTDRTYLDAPDAPLPGIDTSSPQMTNRGYAAVFSDVSYILFTVVSSPGTKKQKRRVSSELLRDAASNAASRPMLSRSACLAAGLDSKDCISQGRRGVGRNSTLGLRAGDWKRTVGLKGYDRMAWPPDGLHQTGSGEEQRSAISSPLQTRPQAKARNPQHGETRNRQRSRSANIHALGVAWRDALGATLALARGLMPSILVDQCGDCLWRAHIEADPVMGVIARLLSSGSWGIPSRSTSENVRPGSYSRTQSAAIQGGQPPNGGRRHRRARLEDGSPPSDSLQRIKPGALREEHLGDSQNRCGGGRRPAGIRECFGDALSGRGNQDRRRAARGMYDCDDAEVSGKQGAVEDSDAHLFQLLPNHVCMITLAMGLVPVIWTCTPGGVSLDAFDRIVVGESVAEPDPVTQFENIEDIQNPTHNPTHQGKPARRSTNPTHFAASDTVFRKSDTIPGNPTHRSAIYQPSQTSNLMRWSRGASEPSQSESRNLDIDGEAISMGESDVVDPPVVSVPASAPSPVPPPHSKPPKPPLSTRRSSRKRGAFKTHEDVPVQKTKKTETAVAPEPSDSEKKRTKPQSIHYTLSIMSGWRLLQPTTLGQLGDDRISDQLSHQFDLKSVRRNDSGVESLACVGIDENWITALRKSTNNRASTVLSVFLDAVEEYGLPSRI